MFDAEQKAANIQDSTIAMIHSSLHYQAIRTITIQY